MNMETQRTEIAMDRLKAVLDSASITDEERNYLKAAIDTLAYVCSEIERKGSTIHQLRRLLFGPQTEKTSSIREKQTNEKQTLIDGKITDFNNSEQNEPVIKNDRDNNNSDDTLPKKSKPKGHGRNGANDYPGAKLITVKHESLNLSDMCPGCKRGKIYRTNKPAVIVRVVGNEPLSAKVWELEKLRCNACGEVFKAQPPANIGKEKYNAKAGAMIGLLKYGTGVPFNRLEWLQGHLGIPMPASTQWEIVDQVSKDLKPIHNELIVQAAQGEVMYNDDTPIRILDMIGKRLEQKIKEDKNHSKRKATFTTGIISQTHNEKIALFFSGSNYAGENLAEVIKKRANNLSAPIQMSDALSRNIPKNLPEPLKTIWCNCLAHARRKFVNAEEKFPEECLHVLDELSLIYKNDKIAKLQDMTKEERLNFHQAKSKPVMERLKTWIDSKSEQIEPNSELGKAFKYVTKRWDKFTVFLHIPGAPLDNNICERILKKAILHRKNSLFYKTQNGANVGDIFMSLIHTAALAKVNPFDYLTQLISNRDKLSDNPSAWTPWCYQETVNQINAQPDIQIRQAS